MLVIIDRFENEFAVVELPDKTMVNLPKKLLPRDAKEGDVVRIAIDQEETKKRKGRVAGLMDKVWE